MVEKKILILAGDIPNPFSYTKTLNKALRLAGLNPDTDIERISMGDVGTLYQEFIAAATRIKPNVIVSLGETTTIDLTNKAPLPDWRGSILPNKGLLHGLTSKVIPSFAPDWIQRGQFQHFWSLVTDLKKAKRQAEFPEIRPITYTSIINSTAKDAVNHLDNLRSDEPWCIDIETRAEQIACFSIAQDTTAICIPIQRPDGPAMEASYEASVWSALNRLMKRNPFMVGQNLTFDMEYLFDYGMDPAGIHMDTMLSHAINFPELPKSLAYLTSLYTDMPFHKNDHKGGTFDDLMEYNNKDTLTTLWCSVEIEKQLKQRNLWTVHQFVTKEIGLALEMQRRRLKVDQTNRGELAKLVDDAMAEVLAKWDVKWNTTMAALANQKPDKPNVNSPLQIREFLYKTLGLQEKTRMGKVVADETAISELRSKHPEIEELDWILTERHLRKLNSSYLNVELEQDGTIGGSWCVHGTETGRWSSGKSPRGRGLNLQTVPKPVRRMVVPPPGYCFIQPDLSQAEARVVAYLAGSQAMIDLFNDPTRSIHMENAQLIFGYLPKKDSPDYVLAKAGVHASNYKITPSFFAVMQGISQVRATQILTGYHRARPEIGKWHEWVLKEIGTKGVLRTPFGRERIFATARAELLLTGKISNDSWKDAISYVPQATIPDLTNKGMVGLWESPIGKELRFQHQGHDSFLCACPVELLGEAATELTKLCTIPFDVTDINGVTRTLTIPVEVAFGFDWMALKSWKGEQTADYEQWLTWTKDTNINADVKKALLAA